MEKADEALYESKNAGRNKVVVFVDDGRVEDKTATQQPPLNLRSTD